MGPDMEKETSLLAAFFSSYLTFSGFVKSPVLYSIPGMLLSIVIYMFPATLVPISKALKLIF